MTDAEYMREYHHQRRQAIVEWMGGRCVKCGSTQDLQFDHVDPALKSFDVNRTYLLTLNNPDVVIELMKCQLLCEPCHREKSAKEKSVEHGGGVSGKKNCPCAPCKARKAEYMSNYKRRKRVLPVSNRSS